MAGRAVAAAGADWWRDAVIYQVYPRSFADGDGDGFGDIAGIASRLDYLTFLGIDAVWINPWYPSPMADAGYDVSDFRGVEPMFGTLQSATDLIEAAHGRGIRVILDIVPNHTSDQHPWFRAAVAAGAGSSQRERYIFRPGRAGGSEPPNDWQSVFGGPAWTRLTEADGTPGEWYLHLFAPQQPDLNWSHPDVRVEFESILRFWFDRGVDGFRIDVANSLAKDPDLPDLAGRSQTALGHRGPDEHPFWDRETVHDIFRSWRAIADEYDPPRMFVAEAWLHSPARLARYVRPGQLHSAFNFEFLQTPWRADAMRGVIEASLEAMLEVGALPTWVLSNHDVARTVTRYAYPQPDRPVRSLDQLPRDVEPNLELGTRRARAAALLMLALPGGAYVYQGEELGLWEVRDLPLELLQDPIWERSGRTNRGRDGCRVPLPWSGDRPPFGFGPAGGAPPWLPQPAAWRALTVEAQTGTEGSMLELYRAALGIRRSHPGLGAGELRWRSSTPEGLVFERAAGLVCLVNFGDQPVELPAHREILLSSGPIGAEGVPSDTAVWLQA